MIEIAGLTKRFGSYEVLRGIDLHVRRGRVTAIVGPNGSGKTTLLKIILGFVRADSGRVTVDGAPVSDDGAYRARIGYMPQTASFPQNLTGGELLAMLGDLRRDGRVARRVPDDDSLVERFGLAPYLDRPVRTLSGGTRQKLSAAIAFRFAPDLLILDEPTAGLDPVASGVFKDRILAERAAGRTFILSSHFMNEIQELADDVVFLLDGRLRFVGALDDLMRETRQANLGRAISHLLSTEVAA